MYLYIYWITRYTAKHAKEKKTIVKPRTMCAVLNGFLIRHMQPLLMTVALRGIRALGKFSPCLAWVEQPSVASSSDSITVSCCTALASCCEVLESEDWLSSEENDSWHCKTIWPKNKQKTRSVFRAITVKLTKPYITALILSKKQWSGVGVSHPERTRHHSSGDASHAIKAVNYTGGNSVS